MGEPQSGIIITGLTNSVSYYLNYTYKKCVINHGAPAGPAAPGGRRVLPDWGRYQFLAICSSSISKISASFGPMLAPAPRVP